MDENDEKVDPDLWVGAVYAAESGSEDIGRVLELLGGPLTTHKVYYSESHDIALMHLRVPSRRETGKTLRMPKLKLGMRIPKKGGTVLRYRLPLHGLDTGDRPAHP